jgi:hypothetical protein
MLSVSRFSTPSFSLQESMPGSRFTGPPEGDTTETFQREWF